MEENEREMREAYEKSQRKITTDFGNDDEDDDFDEYDDFDDDDEDDDFDDDF